MQFTAEQEKKFKERWQQERFASALARRTNEPEEKSGGSWFDPSAWIREIGGSGGAVSGAAMGAPLGIPGMIGGGILGAFLGGGAGSAVEQQVRDKNIDMGKVFKEGLEEAPWGAVPGALKGYKIAKYGTKYGKPSVVSGLFGKDNARRAALRSLSPIDETMRGVGLLDDAGKELTNKAVKQQFKSGIRSSSFAGDSKYAAGLKDDAHKFLTGSNKKGNVLQRAGKSMRQRVINPKVRPNPHSQSQIDDIMNAVGKLGFKGSATSQMGQMDDASRFLSKAVDTQLKNNPTKLNMSAILDDITKVAQGNLEQTKGVQREIARTVQEVAKTAKSGKILDLRQAQKTLGNRLGGVFEAIKKQGRMLSDKEMADLEIWSYLDDVLKINAPKSKELLTLHSKLFDASHGIIKEAGRTIGMPFSNASSHMLARGSQATRDAIGRGLGRAGDALSFAGGQTAGFRGGISGAVKSPFGQQVAARTLGNAGKAGQAGQPAQDTNQMIIEAAKDAGIDPEMIMQILQQQQDPMAQQAGGFGAPQPDPMAQQAGGFGGQSGLVIPREAMTQAMMADLQATGGSNIDKLQKFFEFANYEALNQDEAKTSDSQAKMQTAKTIVDNLMQVFNEVGGAKGLYAGTATDWAGRLNIGEGNEKARAYEQNRMSYLTPIIKAFGEVGVLTDKDREVVATAIPSIRDTQAQAEQKINLLYQMLMTLGQGGSISSMTDENLAMQQELGGFAQ